VTFKHSCDLKMAVFWDVAPCSLVIILTDVQEELTASIIRVVKAVISSGFGQG
jgi:hypothetical protein